MRRLAPVASGRCGVATCSWWQRLLHLGARVIVAAAPRRPGQCLVFVAGGLLAARLGAPQPSRSAFCWSLLRRHGPGHPFRPVGADGLQAAGAARLGLRVGAGAGSFVATAVLAWRRHAVRRARGPRVVRRSAARLDAPLRMGAGRLRSRCRLHRLHDVRVALLREEAKPATCGSCWAWHAWPRRGCGRVFSRARRPPSLLSVAGRRDDDAGAEPGVPVAMARGWFGAVFLSVVSHRTRAPQPAAGDGRRHQRLHDRLRGRADLGPP